MQTALKRCSTPSAHHVSSGVIREARVVAAAEGRSISGLLTDRLEAMIREQEAAARERQGFAKARRQALARLREGLDLRWTPPARD